MAIVTNADGRAAWCAPSSLDPARFEWSLASLSSRTTAPGIATNPRQINEPLNAASGCGAQPPQTRATRPPPCPFVLCHRLCVGRRRRKSLQLATRGGLAGCGPLEGRPAHLARPWALPGATRKARVLYVRVLQRQRHKELGVDRHPPHRCGHLTTSGLVIIIPPASEQASAGLIGELARQAGAQLCCAARRLCPATRGRSSRATSALARWAPYI